MESQNVIEDIEIQSWKGKDDIEIFEQKEVYRVVEHRKGKESLEIDDIEHFIPKQNVDTLWKLIETNCQIGEEYKYKYLVRKLLEHYKFHETENCSLEIFMEAFNGGKNRAKYYFNHYYYCMKILEAKGMVAYLGRGGVIKLQ